MREAEIKIQVHLAESESELGLFQMRLIKAKQVNRQTFLKMREPLAAEKFMMTDREKLFAKFFQAGLAEVANVSDSELAAHIEVMNNIAFEARAKLSAYSKEQGDRRSKRKSNGFLSSVETDDLTQNAINNIKTRTEKLSKREQQIDNMVKMGMDREDAEKLFSPGHVKQKLHEPKPSPPPFVPVKNPFAKATEAKPQEDKQVTIIEETNTVIIENTQTQETQKPTIFNPFKK